MRIMKNNIFLLDNELAPVFNIEVWPVFEEEGETKRINTFEISNDGEPTPQAHHVESTCN